MYPIRFAADYVEGRSRLSTFFRLLLVIPHLIVAFVWSIGLFFTAIGAWIMVSLTGHYPPGLYAFNAKFVRFSARLNSYYYLLTDAFPPFGGDDERDYPVRVEIDGPAERYSRLKAFFRLIVGIPVIVMIYLYSILLGLVAFVAWFVIVITGRQPEGLQDLLRMALSYSTKGNGYLLLLTERYPPITDKPQLESGPASPQLGT